MADGLGSVLAGFDPTAALQLQGGLAAAIGADPSRIPTAGDPFQAAAANITGNVERSRAADLASQITQQRQGALPDLAKILAAPDPYQYVANNPDVNPIARAMVLSHSPLEVAQTKAANVEAAISQLNLGGFGAAGTPQPPGTPVVGPAGTRRAPGLPAAAPPALSPGVLGTGDYVPDPAAIPVDQRAAVYGRMTPRQQALFRAKLATMAKPVLNAAAPPASAAGG